jgi:hypothetical protein
MDKFVRSSVSLLLATSMLAACQTPAPRRTAQDPGCMVTDAAEEHIRERHCSGGDASQLLPQYCTRTGMQTFCVNVQNAPEQNRVVQPDHRIRYDANLGIVVGTMNEHCGRLVIEPNGDVVTEFPELAGAPTPPPC